MLSNFDNIKFSGKALKYFNEKNYLEMKVLYYLELKHMSV